MDTPPQIPAAVQPPNQPVYQAPKKGYGKRPLWQWVVIYVVVGAIVYGAIYYFAYAKKYTTTNGNQNTSKSIY